MIVAVTTLPRLVALLILRNAAAATVLVPAGLTRSTALRPAAIAALAVVSLIAFRTPLIRTMALTVARMRPPAGAVTFVPIDSVSPLTRWRGAPVTVASAAGVVALAPITDMAAYGAAPGGCNSAVTPLMGGTGAEVPERAGPGVLALEPPGER